MSITTWNRSMLSAAALGGLLASGAFGAGTAQPEPQLGVNWAGAEFAPRNLPGVENRDYGWPTAESLDYWKAKGVRLVRLPFSWERLQPALLGEFDPGYLAGLTRSVGLLRDRDMRVVLDLHNYGKYRGQPIGSADVPVAAFADVWRRLAQAFRNETSIWGYGLMNEPACKPWAEIAQAAVDAIRAVDARTPIVVANDYPGWGASPNHIRKYGGDAGKRGDLAAWAAERMPIGNPATFRDPASNLVFEAHFYFDHDNSGTYKKNYEEESKRTDGPGVRVTPDVGVDRVRPFAAWVQRHGVRGFVGEFGVPANPGIDPRWLDALDRAAAFMKTNNLPCTYWAAGTRWTPGREYVIEPQGWATSLPAADRQRDRPQLEVLLRHVR